MNVFRASTIVAGTAARYALWGIGIYIGLRIAGEIAKPVAAKMGEGIATLREKAKEREQTKKADAEQATTDEKGGKTVATESVSIPVEDIAPAAAAAASKVEESTEPEIASSDSDELSSPPPYPLDELPSMKWLKEQLVMKAKEMGIFVDETMTKKDILDAIESRQ